MEERVKGLISPSFPGAHILGTRERLRRLAPFRLFAASACFALCVLRSASLLAPSGHLSLRRLLVVLLNPWQGAFYPYPLLRFTACSLSLSHSFDTQHHRSCCSRCVAMRIEAFPAPSQSASRRNDKSLLDVFFTSRPSDDGVGPKLQRGSPKPFYSFFFFFCVSVSQLTTSASQALPCPSRRPTSASASGSRQRGRR